MIQAKSPLTIKVMLEWTAGKGKKEPQSYFHILNRSIIKSFVGYEPSFLINYYSILGIGVQTTKKDQNSEYQYVAIAQKKVKPYTKQ